MRRRQLDKVLNYDKHANLQVIHLEKRAVSKLEEATDLNLMQSQDVIERANTLINNLTIVSDKNRAEVSALPHYTPAHRQQHSNSIEELARVYEVIDW